MSFACYNIIYSNKIGLKLFHGGVYSRNRKSVMALHDLAMCFSAGLDCILRKKEDEESGKSAHWCSFRRDVMTSQDTVITLLERWNYSKVMNRGEHVTTTFGCGFSRGMDQFH